jgi:hypothetical protein
MRGRLLVVTSAIASIPAVFVVASWCLGRMVQAEYTSSARVSTDGDTVAIPAAGVTVVWIGLLLIVSAVRGLLRGRDSARGKR